MNIPRRQSSVLRSPGHIKPGKRGPSSALPTPRLGTGQLTASQLKQIEDCAIKVPYSAECVAATAAKALGWAGVDVETYRCEICDLFHLTHRRSD